MQINFPVLLCLLDHTTKMFSKLSFWISVCKKDKWSCFAISHWLEDCRDLLNMGGAAVFLHCVNKARLSHWGMVRNFMETYP